MRSPIRRRAGLGGGCFFTRWGDSCGQSRLVCCAAHTETPAQPRREPVINEFVHRSGNLEHRQTRVVYEPQAGGHINKTEISHNGTTFLRLKKTVYILW